MKKLSRHPLVILRAALICIWILACAAFVKTAKILRAEKAAQRGIIFCYRGIARLIGLSIEVKGELAATRPLLLVSNHVSYLDIVALGSVAPVAFTPKAEIAGWPLIGGICRLTGCVFIDRRPSRTQENRARLRAALAKGRVVSLFPEGTTGDGRHPLPFRSSYFALAEEEGVEVQSVGISYTHVHGLPVSVSQLPKIAWYGNMELAPHLMELLKLGPIRARLFFAPQISRNIFKNRKEIATECARQVTENTAIFA